MNCISCRSQFANEIDGEVCSMNGYQQLPFLLKLNVNSKKKSANWITSYLCHAFPFSFTFFCMHIQNTQGFPWWGKSNVYLFKKYELFSIIFSNIWTISYENFNVHNMWHVFNINKKNERILQSLRAETKSGKQQKNQLHWQVENIAFGFSCVQQLMFHRIINCHEKGDS